MKLRTLHLFSLNLCSKFCYLLALIIASRSIAQTPPPQSAGPDSLILGPIKQLEAITNNDKKNLADVEEQIAKNPKNQGPLDNLESIRILPAQMRSILISTDKKYLALLQVPNPECAFYALMQNNLLKSSLGPIDFVHFTAQKKGQSDTLTMTASRDEFLKKIYSQSCLQNKEAAGLFEQKTAKKTIKNLKFVLPKGRKQCEDVYQDWTKNSYLPYLCRYPEILSQKEKSNTPIEGVNNKEIIKKQNFKKELEEATAVYSSLTHFEKTYIDNLCNNLDSSERFCAPYSSQDAWGKAISGEISKNKISHRCSNLLQKDISDNDLNGCAAELLGNPSICTTLGSSNYSALFPRPDCSEISESLNISQLSYDYKDCPGAIDNEAITNTHRILLHFEPRNYISNSQNCAHEVLTTFALLNIGYKNRSAWPLKICFDDKIEKRERCRRIIPSNNQDQKYSEVVGVARALKIIVKAPHNTKCNLIESDKYNPNLLESKVGCYILYNKKNCTSFNCPRKIIWNSNEIKDLVYKGTPNFDYVPNSFSNEAMATSNILIDALKLTNVQIKNLTELKNFLSQMPNRIIHGVGCLEDLLPHIRSREAFNQCSPMPFIVDGFKENDSKTYLSIRTAIDEIHSPRYLEWNFVYGALGIYQQLHPINSWILYGLKK